MEKSILAILVIIIVSVSACNKKESDFNKYTKPPKSKPVPIEGMKLK